MADELQNSLKTAVAFALWNTLLKYRELGIIEESEISTILFGTADGVTKAGDLAADAVRRKHGTKRLKEISKTIRSHMADMPKPRGMEDA